MTTSNNPMLPRNINNIGGVGTLTTVTGGSGGSGNTVIIGGPSWGGQYNLQPGTYTPSVLDAAGSIKCDDLVVGDINFKQLVSQLSTMIPIFIPPEGDVMKNAAVKNAYDAYIDARTDLIAKRAHLDLLIKLAE